jgi:hypothetical protein
MWAATQQSAQQELLDGSSGFTKVKALCAYVNRLPEATRGCRRPRNNVFCVMRCGAVTSPDLDVDPVQSTMTIASFTDEESSSLCRFAEVISTVYLCIEPITSCASGKRECIPPRENGLPCNVG